MKGAGGTDKVIRYGIIGTGMMGCEHIRNLVAMDGVAVTAVADPEARSQRWALRACGERWRPDVHDDHAALLARDDIDAVVVATPNHTHAAVLHDVLASGRHVLVEKPLCTTLDDALALHAAALAHDGVVWMGLEYRYMAPIATLLAHLGEVGRVRMCAIREHRFPFLEKVGHWNRFNRWTGGTLVEKCCHFFDLMNLMVGADPVRVVASGGQDVNHLDERYDCQVPDVIDNAYVLVDYANGARGMLDLCMFAEGARHEQQLVVTGDRARLETTVPGDRVWLGHREGRRQEDFAVRADPRVREVGFHHGSSYLEHLAFQDAIRRGAAPAVTTRDGVRAMALGVAAQQSIASGLPVVLSDLLEMP